MRFIPFIIFLLFIALPLIMPVTPALAQDYSLDDDLIYRINFGSAEDVRVLLEKGANPNARTHQNEIALNVAIERADPESIGIAKALIDKGANLEAVDKYGNTPIINALRLKQDKISLYMLAKGANYNVKTKDGVSLLEYAKLNGDAETQAALQAMIDKEVAYQQSMRTPERFKEIARTYTANSCKYQYWSYFLSSRQAPEKDAQTKQKVDTTKNDLYQQITQIQRYYTSDSLMALHNVASKAVQQIYKSLDGMISNSNRAEQGVGTDADEERRCDKIIKNLPMDFVPVPLDIPAQAAPPVKPASAPSNIPEPLHTTLR